MILKKRSKIGIFLLILIYIFNGLVFINMISESFINESKTIQESDISLESFRDDFYLEYKNI